MRSSAAVRAVAAGTVLLVVPVVADAAVPQRSVTSQHAASHTPRLVASGVERPRVDALRVVGGTTYAAGRFDTVRQGGTTYRGLRNIMAFDKTSGRVHRRFDTRFDGPVRTLEAAPGGGVFAGGAFTTVDGRPRVGLVKLRTDGTVVRRFRPYFGAGTVKDLEVATIRGQRRLLVAGTMKGRLAAVDLDTGARTGLLDAAFLGKIPGARGSGTAVFDMAVSPDGRRLIATGSFTTVRIDGVSRDRRAFVMLDLPDAHHGTRIDPWYYPGFRKECSATDSGDARRIANLQGVDWSPSGRHFEVAATGKVPREGDAWHRGDTAARNAGSSVCDAVGRFALADDSRATWINYTGGDSLWTVQDTGAAIYVQGHMRWLDNPDGFASRPAICTRWADPEDHSSDCTAGIGDTFNQTAASRRIGVGAINPRTGRAFAGWHPTVASRKGGKALVATRSGVWWGSDSRRWNGERRRGLAFTPTAR